VSVLLSNENGTFAAKIDHAVGWEPESVTTADFNGDGKPDRAVTNYTTNNLSLLTNKSGKAEVTARRDQ
jgi:hypothetical protein